MEFEIKITETLTKKVKVDAKDKNEAERKAWSNYYAANDDYVLTADNATCETDIEIIAKQGELFQ